MKKRKRYIFNGRGKSAVRKAASWSLLHTHTYRGGELRRENMASWYPQKAQAAVPPLGLNRPEAATKSEPETNVLFLFL